MNQSSITAWLRRSTLQPALVSSILCWLAFPPVSWGWLVWLAPIGWLLPVAQRELPGRRPYQALWLAGFVFWLLAVHWIRLPHPLNYLAWVVLASYLGVYLPVFVALARVGVHRLGLPLWLVAPIVWTGLDLVRAHLMTGFMMGSLAHTQVEYPQVIQMADLLGEYGVTFLIVSVAASLTSLICSDGLAMRRRLFPLACASVAVGLCLYYGHVRSRELFPEAARSNQSPSKLRIALIQGNTLADWKADAARQQNIMQQYMGLSLEAIELSRKQDGSGVDLVVWPETSFRQTLVTVAAGYQPPSELVPDSYLNAAKLDLAEFVRLTGAGILAGIDRVHLFSDTFDHPHYERYNSSVLVDKQGKILATYDKMHRVPFGEYIPFADMFPVLYQLTPLTGGVRPGKAPSDMRVGDFVLSPNICYETCVPHLIRDHVIHNDEAMPDVLVNLTNDAWYWGSSELEMHLACGIFRTVEQRIPLVVAANGGLSAHVDAYGRVQQVTPRQQTAILLVDLTRRGSAIVTFYGRYGDWFAGLCVVCCLVLAVCGWRGRGTGLPASQSDVAN